MPRGLAALRVAFASLFAASAEVRDFGSTRPAAHVEHWQQRQAAIQAQVADAKSLRAVKLAVSGDSSTNCRLWRRRALRRVDLGSAPMTAARHTGGALDAGSAASGSTPGTAAEGRPLPTAGVGDPVAELGGQLSGGEIARPTGAGRP